MLWPQHIYMTVSCHQLSNIWYAADEQAGPGMLSEQALSSYTSILFSPVLALPFGKVH